MEIFSTIKPKSWLHCIILAHVLCTEYELFLMNDDMESCHRLSETLPVLCIIMCQNNGVKRTFWSYIRHAQYKHMSKNNPLPRFTVKRTGLFLYK